MVHVFRAQGIKVQADFALGKWEAENPAFSNEENAYLGFHNGLVTPARDYELTAKGNLKLLMAPREPKSATPKDEP